MRYRYTGDLVIFVPELGLIVEPGQEVETDLELNHAEFKLLKEKAASKTKEE